VISKLADWLKGECEIRGMSMRAASQDIGVSHGTLSRIALGLTPDLDTLEHLAKWANVSLGYLLNLMGYEVGEVGTHDDALIRAIHDNPIMRETAGVLRLLSATCQREVLHYARYVRDTQQPDEPRAT